eukprot:gene8057-12519_t
MQKTNLTFTIVDPTKEKKKKWIQTIPSGISLFGELTIKFKPQSSSEFTLEEPKKNTKIVIKEPKKLTEKEVLIHKINEKLKGTGLSFEGLEEKYSNDPLVHVIYELEGNSIWFNDTFSKVFKRPFTHYMTIDIVKVLAEYNPDHPAVTFLPDFIKSHAESLKFDTSDLISPAGVVYSGRAELQRIDKDDKPFAYFIHFDANVK